MSNELILRSELPQIILIEARRRRTSLVLLFAVIALAGLVAGLFWPKKYFASTTILVQESNIIKPLMEGRAVPTGNADRAAIAREVIFSRKIMDEILRAGGWLDAKPSALQQERLIDEIKNRTSITTVRENLIRIDYNDSRPERALQVTQRLAALFIEESLAAKERESREAYEFINTQVEDYRHKLTEAEDKLKAFRASNDDARPGSETDTNSRIAGLRTQLENARMDLTEQRSKEAALRQELSGEAAYSSVQSRAAMYRSRLSDLQGQLDQLLLTDTNEHPDVVRVRHQMQDLHELAGRAETAHQMRRAAGDTSGGDENVRINPVHTELRTRLAEIRRNAAAAQARMDVSESLLQAELERSRRIADTANTLSELQRDYEVNRDIYQDMLKRRENARVSMNLDAEHRGLTFDIQEPATLPLRPSGLRFMHFGLAGLGLGLALPLALLFAWLRLDPRVRSANQLQQMTGLPVLASLPVYPSEREHSHTRARDRLLIGVLLVVAATYATAIAFLWITAP
jgi:polysaccharide chain length determinant protein (PEP-CTERM system associated)